MTTSPHQAISATVVRRIVKNLSSGEPVHESLPGGGLISIDRLLPFLCVYRNDADNSDEVAGTFVSSEAAFLVAPGDAPRRKGLKQLVRAIAELSFSKFGAFLLIEIRPLPIPDIEERRDADTGELVLPNPRFVVSTSPYNQPRKLLSSLEFALRRIKSHGQKAVVESREHAGIRNDLLSPAETEQFNASSVCIQIEPIYRHPKTGVVYDSTLDTLRRGVAHALKRASFAFALERTNTEPQHYWVLGRRKLSKVVFDIDRELAEVSSAFKFLLAVTPINAERAWIRFSDSDYSKPPILQYRPLESDPLLLKRRLLNIRVDEVDDPTLADLFRQTQDELDRQITMLSDLDTHRFLHGSIQVFGGVEPSLLELALRLLSLNEEPSENESLSAKQFAAKATREIEFYKRQAAGFSAQAIIRDDLYSGLLVTGGDLLLGRETSVGKHRANALLQHEVGTHLVTYYNGAAQPLTLLKVGLAGYDELQEGIAVLSEYLVGGLSTGRLRTLAARVVAVDALIRGETFTQTFQLLWEQHGFDPKSAYTIVLRVYRGGGLTKDAVYLRGLVQVLEYLAAGGELEPLFVGKLALRHIPIVRELLHRKILAPAKHRPRYLDNTEARCRIDRVRDGKSVLELLDL